MNKSSTIENNLLDLSSFVSPGDMLLEVSSIVDRNELKNKDVKLDLGNISLTASHILGIKSILESAENQIELVYTNSVHTHLAALGVGLNVSNLTPEEDVEKNVKEEWETVSLEIAEQQDSEEIISGEIADEVDSIENQDEQSEIEPDSVEYSEENNEIQAKMETLYLKQTLRSGQVIDFDGNVVIIGDCHSGSEINVSGDITVWGILSGIAHAGIKGNKKVCIRALKINAVQLRIAGLYSRRPDRLNVEKLERSDIFMPEEARISNGEIIIYSLNS